MILKPEKISFTEPKRRDTLHEVTALTSSHDGKTIFWAGTVYPEHTVLEDVVKVAHPKQNKPLEYKVGSGPVHALAGCNDVAFVSGEERRHSDAPIRGNWVLQEFQRRQLLPAYYLGFHRDLPGKLGPLANSVASTTTGKWIAVGGGFKNDEQGFVQIASNQNRPPVVLAEFATPVLHVCFGSNTQLIAATSHTLQLLLWNGTKSKLIRKGKEIDFHDPISSIKVSSRGILGVISGDKLWLNEQGKHSFRVWPLEKHVIVRAVAFSSNGRYCVIGVDKGEFIEGEKGENYSSAPQYLGGNLMVLDVEAHTVAHTYPLPFKSWVKHLTIAGNRIFAGTYQGTNGAIYEWTVRGLALA